MAKSKITVQDQEAPAITSTNTSVVKKQRKMNDKRSLNDVHKNDSKKPSTSNETAKNIFTSKQNSKKKKHSSKNKSDVNDIERSDIIKVDTDCKIIHKKNKFGMNTERSDFITKYLKDEKTEIFQKKRNTNSKNCKRNNKRKQDLNLDHVNQNAARVVDTAKEKKKKLQILKKKSVGFEHKKIKIEKLKKMTEKKMKRMLAKVEAQQIKTDEILKLNKHMIKIKQLEETLARKLRTKHTLKDRETMQLKAKFRFINEMLYNNDSLQSKHYFKQNLDAFKAYQMGYKWQLEQWGTNPLDVIISSIIKLPMDYVIADFGCGEARLAASVPHTVHSFDFIALNDGVKACDVAHTPLQMNSVHVVVFCLSLMGSNFNDYIIEANRVLKNNGILKIAELESRFEDVKDFIKMLRNYGFKSTWKDLSHNLFYFMDFKKEKNINIKKTLPSITLKSYLYKKK